MCILVATAAEEVVYELVAEPQEPPEQARQEERIENPAQGWKGPRPTNLVLPRQAPVHNLLF